MHKGTEHGGLVRAQAAIVHRHRREQNELVLGSGAGHIQKPPLLFIFVVIKQGVARGETILHQVDDQHDRPLQPFGRVHCGQGYGSVVIAFARFRAGVFQAEVGNQ